MKTFKTFLCEATKNYTDVKAFLHPTLNKWVTTYKADGKQQTRIHSSEESAKEMADSLPKIKTKVHKRADSTGGHSAKAK